MTKSEKLQQVRRQIEGWRGQFLARRDPPWEVSQVSKLVALLTEAREIIRKSLGEGSAYFNDIPTFMTPGRGFHRQPENDEIVQCLHLIDAAVRDIQAEEQAAERTTEPVKAPTISFVSEHTILELKALPRTAYDFSRLVALCRELNVTAAGEAHMATMMLLRAIMDHIPPAMGNFTTFADFAAQYPGRKSFKQQMANFNQLLRKAADGHLHCHIRRRESVPTAEEANFRTPLGELLREIIVRHKPEQN